MKISTIWAWNRWLALSDVLAYNGNDILVYARDTSSAKEINEHHTSQKYLGDKIIDKKIQASSNLEEVLEFSNYLVIAVPSKSIVSILKEIKKIKNSDNYFFINATKWFANKKTIQQTISEYFPVHRWLVSVLWPAFERMLWKWEICWTVYASLWEYSPLCDTRLNILWDRTVWTRRRSNAGIFTLSCRKRQKTARWKFSFYLRGSAR